MSMREWYNSSVVYIIHFGMYNELPFELPSYNWLRLKNQSIRASKMAI